MKNRDRTFELAKARDYDLVVIGGGIVGAGIAQDASCRGLSVLLIEKDDFAAHTSSKTTKLIHGGLRYLEQGRLKLTYQLSQERALLEQLAPHLVKDISFVLPLTDKDKAFSWKARLGLTMYDLLSSGSLHSPQHHESIEPKEVFEAAPALAQDNITGGLRFHDAITDDARLVLTVIKSSVSQGAHVLNYVEAIGLQHHDKVVREVECRDRLDGSTFTLRCKVCVNATGVFSDQIIGMVKKNWKARVIPDKGIHIVLPFSAFPTNTGLFLPTPDKRYVFVLPWQRALMVGTTDSPYSGDLNNPMPHHDEIDYLLQILNKYNSGRALVRTDVKAAWAGLRPLINPIDLNKASDQKKQSKTENGKTSVATSKLSREHEIFIGPKGLVNVIGGKLTNFRMMGEQVIDRILDRYPELTRVEGKRTRTKRLMLGGWLDKEDFLASTALIASRARKLFLDPATIDHLTSTYGKEALLILDLVEANPELKERICPEFPPIMAEVNYSVEHEMAISLEDVLSRRTRLAMLNQEQCLESAPKVVHYMQSLLNWDNVRVEAELNSLEASFFKIN
jgi:glycerol-3-phosphate dehydrogenase